MSQVENDLYIWCFKTENQYNPQKLKKQIWTFLNKLIFNKSRQANWLKISITIRNTSSKYGKTQQLHLLWSICGLTRNIQWSIIKKFEPIVIKKFKIWKCVVQQIYVINFKWFWELTFLYLDNSILDIAWMDFTFPL